MSQQQNSVNSLEDESNPNINSPPTSFHVQMPVYSPEEVIHMIETVSADPKVKDELTAIIRRSAKLSEQRAALSMSITNICGYNNDLRASLAGIGEDNGYIVPEGISYDKSQNRYRTSYKDGKRLVQKVFSIRAHGERKALSMAVEQRKQWIREGKVPIKGIRKESIKTEYSQDHKSMANSVTGRAIRGRAPYKVGGVPADVMALHAPQGLGDSLAYASKNPTVIQNPSMNSSVSQGRLHQLNDGHNGIDTAMVLSNQDNRGTQEHYPSPQNDQGYNTTPSNDPGVVGYGQTRSESHQDLRGIPQPDQHNGTVGISSSDMSFLLENFGSFETAGDPNQNNNPSANNNGLGNDAGSLQYLTGIASLGVPTPRFSAHF